MNLILNIQLDGNAFHSSLFPFSIDFRFSIFNVHSASVRRTLPKIEIEIQYDPYYIAGTRGFHKIRQTNQKLSFIETNTIKKGLRVFTN